MTTNVNYDLNKALYYLGPKASQRGINYYISNIAITILRLINYLYEGKWYNNNTARLIVLQYAKDRIADYSPILRTDIQRLFREIKLRPNVDLNDNVRVSLTVNPLSSESRIGKTFCREVIEEGRDVLLGECTASELNTYLLDRELEMKAPIHLDVPRPPATVGSAPEMKPRTKHEIFEKACNQFQGAFWNFKENLSVSEYEEAKIAARQYTTQLMSRAELTESETAKGEEAAAIVSNYENALTRKQLCAKALAFIIKENTEVPFLKQEFYKMRDISEMLLSTDFSALDCDGVADHLLQNEENLIQHIESQFLPLSNPLFKNIKDPHKLLRVALFETQRELNAATPTEEKVVRQAIYNLIKQAYVNRSGCHPVLELNECIHVSTPAPKKFFTADGLYETEVYATDLFSSLTDPSDPLKAKELINEGCSLEDISALIDKMANQIKSKHLSHVNEALRDSSTPGDIKGSFEDYIVWLKTPHDIMHHALLFAAHSLAKKQFSINADDVASNAWVSNYICSSATFLILSHAKANSDFSLQLNDHVTIECEKFFVKELLDDNQLISRELFRSNIFTPDHIEDVVPTDPVRVQAILESFANDKKFIERYILAKPLQRLYEPENDVNSFASFQFDLVNRGVENLPTEQKVLIKALKREIENISSHLTSFYNGMCKELCSMITSPNQTRPVQQPFETYIEPTSGEIQWQHIDIQALKGIHSRFQSRFAILDRSDREEIEDVLVIRKRSLNQQELPKHLAITPAALRSANQAYGGLMLVNQQYDSLYNPADAPHCMYGALAQEIFGVDEVRDEIDDYINFLRKTASSYIKAHADDFIETELIDEDRDWIRTQINYEAALEILKPRLLARLHAFCDNEDEDGDDRMMRAIAKVFGIGIDVIYYANRLHIDSKGVLLPNAGVEPGIFPKAFLQYSGYHFEVLRRKTR